MPRASTSRAPFVRFWRPHRGDRRVAGRFLCRGRRSGMAFGPDQYRKPDNSPDCPSRSGQISYGLHWRSRRLQDPWCYFGDPSHRAPVVRDVVAAGLQVRERNLHVSSEGSKINRRHWNCSHETPAAFRRATQSRQVSTIFVERKSFEVSAAASEQVDDRSQRFHSLKLSHWFSLKEARVHVPDAQPRLSWRRNRTSPGATLADLGGGHIRAVPSN